MSVSPGATTSYTLTATNAAGSATATITVTVETQLPTITDFWANPYQIASGQTATLTWAVSRADSVKLNGTTMTGNTTSVAPTTTTTYALTATNLIGSVSATVTVSVGTPGSLVWTKTIVYGFGQELAEDQPGMGTTFIQSDYVGSPSVTTDANGIVIGRSKNLPFGERMSSWGQKTIRRYTNHEDDPDSGAIYMQAREQLPAYGKFAQTDPAYDQAKLDPESWNLYTYVTNNPVTHTDPDGRTAKLTGAQMAMLEDTGMLIDGSQMYVLSDDGGGGGLTLAADGSLYPDTPMASNPGAGDSAGNATAGTGGGSIATPTGVAPSAPAETKTPDPNTPSAQTNFDVSVSFTVTQLDIVNGGHGDYNATYTLSQYTSTMSFTMADGFQVTESGQHSIVQGDMKTTPDSASAGSPTANGTFTWNDVVHNASKNHGFETVRVFNLSGTDVLPATSPNFGTNASGRSWGGQRLQDLIDIHPPMPNAKNGHWGTPKGSLSGDHNHPFSRGCWVIRPDEHGRTLVNSMRAAVANGDARIIGLDTSSN